MVRLVRGRSGIEYVVPVEGTQEITEYDHQRYSRGYGHKQQEHEDGAFDPQNRPQDLPGDPNGLRQWVVEERIEAEYTYRLEQPAEHYHGSQPEQKQKR